MSYIHPVEELVHSTVRIECETAEGPSSGTGYFYAFNATEAGNVPCVVTNKHVVEGATRGRFHLSIKGPDGKPKLGEHFPIEFEGFESAWIKHPEADIDLAILPLAPILQEANNRGLDPYYILLSQHAVADSTLLDTLPSSEEIIMIGYPNGIWDEKHNLPVIRKGITATHPKLPLNGKPEFLIDAACFPGSSGSPVFLANIGSFVNEKGALCAGNRIALLGTLYAGPQHTATGEVRVVDIPTANTPVAFSTIPNNLGLVINGSKLLDFEQIVSERLEKQERK